MQSNQSCQLSTVNDNVVVAEVVVVVVVVVVVHGAERGNL